MTVPFHENPAQVSGRRGSPVSPPRPGAAWVLGGCRGPDVPTAVQAIREEASGGPCRQRQPGHLRGDHSPPLVWKFCFLGSWSPVLPRAPDLCAEKGTRGPLLSPGPAGRPETHMGTPCGLALPPWAQTMTPESGHSHRDGPWAMVQGSARAVSLSRKR